MSEGLQVHKVLGGLGAVCAQCRLRFDVVYVLPGEGRYSVVVCPKCIEALALKGYAQEQRGKRDADH